MIENRRFAVSNRLPRRALLAGAGALALSDPRGGTAVAATSGLAVIGQDGWLFPLWDATSRFDQQQLRTTAQVMNEAIAALKAKGTEVVVAMVPSKARTYRQHLPGDVRLPADIDKRYPAALAEMRRPGTLVPDLDTLFRNLVRTEPARQLYFRTDTHWLPIGAEVAAVEIAQQMKASLRLPPGSRPGTSFSSVVTRANPVGDLVRFLPEADRAKYPAERYQVREVAAAGGAAALVEDDSADVVVVGNSFVQPRFGFQALLSNQLGRSVGLAWRPNNYGAYFTLLDYVKSPAFRQQRPKVIVWTHLEFDMQNLPNSSSWGQNAMPPQAFLAELRRALGA
jgi:alginate O-acetyltransferase complex protein AlgJ